MSSQQKISYEQIHRLASDIREIKDFTENHGFDSSLIAVNITPEKSSTSEQGQKSTKLILILATIGVLALSCINIYFDVSDKVSTILLVSGIGLAGVSAMAAQLKFKNGAVTGIFTTFLLAVIAIAFDIYTAREVMENNLNTRT